MTKTGGKGDKHSKICTRKGTRDRRIRLSANTAIRFYDVQDRLGCDRPSNVIDWLMKEAKAAIDELNAEHTHLLLQDLFLPDYSTPSVSEAFHRTPGDQTEQHLIQQQHVIEHCFNESQFANLRSRNSYFCSYPNYNELEGYEFVNREPLQSSFQIPIADTDTPNNGVSGIWVEPEIQLQEAEEVEEKGDYDHGCYLL